MQHQQWNWYALSAIVTYNSCTVTQAPPENVWLDDVHTNQRHVDKITHAVESLNFHLGNEDVKKKDYLNTELGKEIENYLFSRQNLRHSVYLVSFTENFRTCMYVPYVPYKWTWQTLVLGCVGADVNQGGGETSHQSLPSYSRHCPVSGGSFELSYNYYTERSLH